MKKTISLALLTLLFAFSQQKSTLNKNDFQNEMLKAVNDLRAEGCQCGDEYMPPVAPLVWSYKLEEAALNHAIDMDKNDFFSHSGSDGSHAWDRVGATGYDWSRVGENIHYGSHTVASAVLSWKNSPGHCKNMMSAEFAEMGAATIGSQWVQVFATE